MTDFDLGGTCVVKGRLETLITDHQVAARKEGHDSTLADTGITDN